MCGIIVIANSTQDEWRVRQMGASMAHKVRHRGPDRSGMFVATLPGACQAAGTAGAAKSSCPLVTVIAHERLSIVDPQSGRQPLFDGDRKWCVSVNGEIYNHLEIRAKNLTEQETGKLTSHSDCAVIAPLLAKMSPKQVVELLDGPFAFVAVELATGRIVAARDPIGINPLYVGFEKGGALCFSSELKALQPYCAGVSIFPPGHYFDSNDTSKFDFGGGRLERYFNPLWWSLSGDVPSKKVDLKIIRELLEKAVRKRMMADCPFGILISGGLDSSLIAAILAREMKSKKMKTPLCSYSIGVSRESPDLIAARKVADLLKTKHTEVIFTVAEGIDAIREVIYSLETYDVTTIRAATPLFLLCRSIQADGLKFVLSGEGADEVFGGYLYFHKAPSSEEFHRETQRKVHQLHYYDVLRANKASMAASVEIRVPFLDKEFLEYAMEIDPSDKMCVEREVAGVGKVKIEKHILREAFQDYADEYIPKEILWRQKEQFSDGVGYSWIDGLKDFAEERVTDQQMTHAAFIFPHNTPKTKEAYYFRTIFAEMFPIQGALESVPGGPSIACSSSAAIAWDAFFSKNADQSGRSVLGVHNAATQFKDAEAAAKK